MNRGTVEFLRNILSWFASNLLSKVVAAILFILLTRHTDLAQVGTYVLATTFLALCLPLTSWGLEHIFIRDVSANPSLSSTYLPRFLILRLLFALIVYLLLFTVVRQIGYDTSAETVILLFGVTLIADGISDLLQSVLVTFENTHYMLYITAPINIVRLTAGTTALYLNMGVWGIIVVLIGCSILRLTALLFVVTTFVSSVQIRIEHLVSALSDLQKIFREIFPFVLIDLFWVIEYQSGSIVLSRMRGQEVVGLYGSAYTMLSVAMLIGQAFMMTIFPLLSRLHSTGSEAFDRVYKLSCLYILVIGLSVSMGITLFYQPLVAAIFPASYGQVGPILIPLIWTMPLFFLHTVISRVMLLENEQGRLALFSGIGAIVNLIITPLMIIWASAFGAGWARLISYTIFFVTNYAFVHRNIHPLNIYYLIPKPLFCIIVSALIILGLEAIFPLIPFVAYAGLLVASYGCCLWFTDVIQLADLRYLSRILGAGNEHKNNLKMSPDTH